MKTLKDIDFEELAYPTFALKSEAAVHVEEVRKLFKDAAKEWMEKIQITTCKNRKCYCEQCVCHRCCTITWIEHFFDLEDE